MNHFESKRDKRTTVNEYIDVLIHSQCKWQSIGDFYRQIAVADSSSSSSSSTSIALPTTKITKKQLTICENVYGPVFSSPLSKEILTNFFVFVFWEMYANTEMFVKMPKRKRGGKKVKDDFSSRSLYLLSLSLSRYQFATEGITKQEKKIRELRQKFQGNFPPIWRCAFFFLWRIFAGFR